MKPSMNFADLVSKYNNASVEERHKQILFAFEAEYDVDRPFEVEWAENDSHFTFNGYTYFYKPQYPEGLDNVVTGELVSQSPHFYEFIQNK
jgi:hypothetical protein